MKKYLIKTAFIGFLLVSALPSFGGQVQVEEKIRVKMSPHTAWAIVGSFQSLDRWHPVVVSSESIGTGRDKDDVRVLKLEDESLVIERLIEYDEEGMVYSYSIIDSPLPIANYVAQIEVRPSRHPRKAKVIWSSTFDPVGISESEAIELMSGIYKAGLEYLQSFER